MITIGTEKLAIRTPADLDARLVEATGCTAAEHTAMLAGQPQASHLARALHPFLKEEVAVQDLATSIAAGDVAEITQQVRALYAALKAEAPHGGE